MQKSRSTQNRQRCILSNGTCLEKVFSKFSLAFGKEGWGSLACVKNEFSRGLRTSSLIRACADTEGKLKFYYEMRHSEVPTRFPNALIFYFLLAVI